MHCACTTNARRRKGKPPALQKLLQDKGFWDGPAEARTPDPLIKSQLLYQLSYRPTGFLPSDFRPRNRLVTIRVVISTRRSKGPRRRKPAASRDDGRLSKTGE